MKVGLARDFSDNWSLNLRGLPRRRIWALSGKKARPKRKNDAPLRANIDETVLPVVITEQGENRNQCEEQRNIFGFSHGFACR
jgi:hypothetical protein